MQRRPPAARLILLALLSLVVLSAAQAQALLQPQLFLPILDSGPRTPGPTPTSGPTRAPATATRTATHAPATSATATSTATRTSVGNTAIPTDTSTATPTDTSTPVIAEVSGSVRLRPISASTAPQQAPQRYVLVLDVSGSQNMNFLGQGLLNGQIVQCTNGPPGSPPHLNCGSPQYAWPVVEERRIYVQKQATMRFIGQLNMPGNPGYDESRPPDQAVIVAYNDTSPTSWHFPASWDDPAASDPAALQEQIRVVNSFQGDPYKVQGGTHWAAGLYRASLALADAPASVERDGLSYDYGEQLVFVTDGVANFFLDPAASSLKGAQSSVSTYPHGTYCRGLGSAVVENAPCQTTDVGGTYQGRDRPITQAVQVSREQIQALAGRPVDVYAVALSYLAETGLRDGIASVPANFYAAPTLEVSDDGLNNVDAIFDAILAHSRDTGCRPSASGPWVTAVAAENLPADIPLAPPAVGEVILRNLASGARQVAPILRDAESGALSFQLAGLPAGEYALSAYVFYRGDDGVTRSYALLYRGEEAVPELTLRLTGGAQNLGPLSIVLAGDVCAAP